MYQQDLSLRSWWAQSRESGTYKTVFVMGKTTLSPGWFVEKGSEPAVHVLQRRLVFSVRAIVSM